MKKKDFEELSDLIKKSVFVNSIDEVWVGDDVCSVMILKNCPIDEEGLLDYLSDELGESFEVIESEFYGDRVEQWKETNGIEEDDDEVEDDEQHEALGRVVVQPDEVLGHEHEVHQADGREHARLLQQEDDVGHKRLHRERHRLRKYDIAHNL